MSIQLLSQDFAEDSAAYIGVFCDRASTLKLRLFGLRVACLLTLLVGSFYLVDAEHWLPGNVPPLWLSLLTWALVGQCVVAALKGWWGRLESYEQAIITYSELYRLFCSLAQGQCPKNSTEGRALRVAVERFDEQRRQVAGPAVTYRELGQARSNFRQQV